MRGSYIIRDRLPTSVEQMFVQIRDQFVMLLLNKRVNEFVMCFLYRVILKTGPNSLLRDGTRNRHEKMLNIIMNTLQSEMGKNFIFIYFKNIIRPVTNKVNPG